MAIREIVAHRWGYDDVSGEIIALMYEVQPDDWDEEANGPYVPAVEYEVRFTPDSTAPRPRT